MARPLSHLTGLMVAERSCRRLRRPGGSKQASPRYHCPLAPSRLRISDIETANRLHSISYFKFPCPLPVRKHPWPSATNLYLPMRNIHIHIHIALPLPMVPKWECLLPLWTFLTHRPCQDGVTRPRAASTVQQQLREEYAKDRSPSLTSDLACGPVPLDISHFLPCTQLSPQQMEASTEHYCWSSF